MSIEVFMKMTALYIRTSTDKQQTGLEAQKRALIEYCKNHSITDYRVYSDSGVSGTKEKRPALNQLMIDIEMGKVSAVIVYSFSRFARSVSHLMQAMEVFKKLEVDFVSLTENIDTKTPMGKAMFVIISAISALERDLIAERVKNGMINARAKGKQIGRPETAPLDSIKSLRRRGLTYRQIAEVLGVGHGSISKAIAVDSNNKD
jgi:DNA invertase Pin-like site-specific DNA recombinase